MAFVADYSLVPAPPAKYSILSFLALGIYGHFKLELIMLQIPGLFSASPVGIHILIVFLVISARDDPSDPDGQNNKGLSCG